MAEIDWSALRTPDYATNALKATTLGREDGLALAKQNALKTYASDPDAGVQQLMAVDPATAVTLQKAQAEQRQQASQVQAGQAAASGDLDAAARIAGGAGNFDLMSKIQGMSKDQRAVASQAYGELASTAMGLKKYPTLEERQAKLQEQAPRLQALGVTAQQIGNFVPTDDNIDTFASAQLGVKGQIEQADKDRTFGLQKDQFGEVVRHNQADETHATAQLGETTRHDRVDETNSSVTARAAAQNASTNAQKLKLMVDGGGMDPDVVDFYAQRNAKDGYVPSIGMGPAAAAIKAQILARSAQIQRGQGLTGADAAATVAGAKGNAAALTSQSKIAATVKAAEQTAGQTADLALNLARQGGAGPSAQLFNRPIQAIRGQLSDPKAAQFNHALGTFRDEAAKVLAGNGQPTDALRHEIDERINKTMSIPELEHLIGTIKQEMAIRSRSFDDSQAGLRDSIRGGGPSAPSTRPPLSSFQR